MCKSKLLLLLQTHRWLKLVVLCTNCGSDGQVSPTGIFLICWLPDSVFGVLLPSCAKRHGSNKIAGTGLKSLFAGTVWVLVGPSVSFVGTVCVFVWCVIAGCYFRQQATCEWLFWTWCVWIYYFNVIRERCATATAAPNSSTAMKWKKWTNLSVTGRECAIFKESAPWFVGAVHPLTRQTMIHNVTMPIVATSSYSGSWTINKQRNINHSLLVTDIDMQHSKWWRFSFWDDSNPGKIGSMQHDTNINGSTDILLLYMHSYTYILI